MSFKIGDIEIKEKVILAPMAGITSFSYRKFMRQFGVSYTYTEMISDSGLIYGNEETKRLSYTDGSEYPLALQLFGGNIEKMLKAIDILESSDIKYDVLDINLACPVPKVLKGGAGSYLLTDLDNLYDFMKKIVDRSKKPVTAKIRLGFNEINVIEIAKTLERAGVKFLAIHARTKKELYSGLPHYEAIRDLKKYIKIPFAISGNIFSVEDAKKALEITGADAVCIARGAIGNPELITNINKALNDEEYDETLDINRQKTHLKQYAKLLLEEKGERQATSMLKGIAPKFFYGFDNAKQIRKRLVEIKSIDELNDILNAIS